MTKDEALKMALEALNDLSAWNDGEVGGHMDEPYSAEVARRTITAIKEALAQPEQEQDGECKYCTDGCPACDARKLPAQRTWVGLTQEEKREIRYSHMTSAEFIEFIEAKLKDKNTSGQE